MNVVFFFFKGVIKVLKGYYRSALVRKYIQLVEGAATTTNSRAANNDEEDDATTVELNVDILQAMHLLVDAWENKVSQATIR